MITAKEIQEKMKTEKDVSSTLQTIEDAIVEASNKGGYTLYACSLFDRFHLFTIGSRHTVKLNSLGQKVYDILTDHGYVIHLREESWDDGPDFNISWHSEE